MSDQTAQAPEVQSSTSPKRNVVQALELDIRLLGMIGAFFVIAVGFHLYTGFSRAGFSLGMLTEGTFLTPRNLFNLSIQTASVAIMATGMVFIIVMRHIDLSVGALLCTCSAVMAMTQTSILPDMFNLPLGHPMIPWIAILAGLIVGLIIGSFQGWLIGYQLIPAFIVTLGGFLVWRNVGWFMTDGATIGPLDPTFQLFGGISGTLGESWSWLIGCLASVAAVFLMFSARRTRVSHGFPVKPVSAEIAISAIVVASILGFIAVMNSYEVPIRVIERDFADYGCATAENCSASYGLPISVIVLLVVAIVMTVIAQRTRLGRYIFATGGNPDATKLTGVNTRLLTVKIFAIMGVLCAIAAIVASARQTYHTNDIGTLDELRVIAAAVIGGTALAGGIGTIYGAIIGALIMQSLQSGMAMVGVDAPYQNIVVGAVLVLAVWVDIQYRKKTGAK